MEPLFFVMAIMGCGDAGACTQARVLPARYETAAQCRAALPAKLAENTDLPFPAMEADCRAHGIRLAKADLAARKRG